MLKSRPIQSFWMVDCVEKLKLILDHFLPAYLLGASIFRLTQNSLEEEVGCAKSLVDTLVGCGFLRH